EEEPAHGRCQADAEDASVHRAAAVAHGLSSSRRPVTGTLAPKRPLGAWRRWTTLHPAREMVRTPAGTSRRASAPAGRAGPVSLGPVEEQARRDAAPGAVVGRRARPGLGRHLA